MKQISSNEFEGDVKQLLTKFERNWKSARRQKQTCNNDVLREANQSKFLCKLSKFFLEANITEGKFDNDTSVGWPFTSPHQASSLYPPMYMLQVRLKIRSYITNNKTFSLTTNLKRISKIITILGWKHFWKEIYKFGREFKAVTFQYLTKIDWLQIFRSQLQALRISFHTTDQVL